MQVPIEPPFTPWVFPDPTESDDDLIAVGADLAPATLLSAYRQGLFPMPLAEFRAMSWWSPRQRGVLPLASLRVTRSMRQSAKRYQVTVDKAYADVLDACGDPSRPGGWIDHEIKAAYTRLHDLGWAHSLEVWSGSRLVGGLYGVAVGGLFTGESMFHHARDASKVALMGLVDLLDDGVHGRLLDVQWATPHLESLGAVEVPRKRYLRLLSQALELPLPSRWR
ncbi:MAG: leucyl/phenylalanyl-tRNA--protein transferase [Nocardioidaceae bacterium]